MTHGSHVRVTDAHTRSRKRSERRVTGRCGPTYQHAPGDGCGAWCRGRLQRQQASCSTGGAALPTNSNTDQHARTPKTHCVGSPERCARVPAVSLARGAQPIHVRTCSFARAHTTTNVCRQPCTIGWADSSHTHTLHVIETQEGVQRGSCRARESACAYGGLVLGRKSAAALDARATRKPARAQSALKAHVFAL